MLSRVTRNITLDKLDSSGDCDPATPEQSLIVAIIARAVHDSQGLGQVDSYNAGWIRSDAEAWLRNRTRPAEPWPC